jgi:hypothetical protein
LSFDAVAFLARLNFVVESSISEFSKSISGHYLTKSLLKNVLPKKSSKTPSIIDYLAIINPACLKLAGL